MMAFAEGSGSAALAWKARSMLSAAGRKRARRIADRFLAPLGSINGALCPSGSVALSFDDGPDPIVTPRVLDLLRQRDVRATFFVLTDRAVQSPELMRRIVSEGHEVGLHSDSHVRLTLLSAAEVRRRLSAARDRLERVGGQPVRFFRPPFGAQSVATYLAARSCGLEVVVWGPYAEDWIESPPEAVAARGLKGLMDGDVLLLHDGLETPPGEPIPTFDRVRAFELILDGLSARGLRAATVGDLILSGQARRTAWFRP
jgi:peptidoglycan/xylan/chitin deacetylase (PgdA/CDA1 family)